MLLASLSADHKPYFRRESRLSVFFAVGACQCSAACVLPAQQTAPYWQLQRDLSVKVIKILSE